MSRSEVDLQEVQDMLPDTVRDMAGRIGCRPPWWWSSSSAARPGG